MSAALATSSTREIPRFGSVTLGETQQRELALRVHDAPVKLGFFSMWGLPFALTNLEGDRVSARFLAAEARTLPDLAIDGERYSFGDALTPPPRWARAGVWLVPVVGAVVFVVLSALEAPWGDTVANSIQPMLFVVAIQHEVRRTAWRPPFRDTAVGVCVYLVCLIALTLMRVA